MEEFEKIKRSDGLWSHYGELSPLIQHHFTSNEEKKTFHNPPRRKGLFLFPKGYEEMFLIGSTMQPQHISNKSYLLKNTAGECLTWKDHITEEYRAHETTRILGNELQKLLKRCKIKQKQLFCDAQGCIAVLRRPKVIQYKGELWHHLGEFVKDEEILASTGSWVKTSYETWKQAFRKNQHSALKQLHKEDDIRKEMKESGLLGRNPYKSKMRISVSRDELEVFITRIK